MFNVPSFFGFKDGGKFTGLLDEYSGAAVAYSLRRLSNLYIGDAIRVRRSSDNAEKDIGFDSDGQLDTTALLAHVGTSGTDNGFIETWYDQSGNSNDATNTTTSEQPQIVSGGSLITRNSKPFIQASSTQYFTLDNILNTPIGGDYSIWSTYEKDTSGNQGVFIGSGFSSYHWLDYGLNQYIQNNNFITISSSHNINTLYLINTITDYDVGATMYRNGTDIGSRGALTSVANSQYYPANNFRTATITFSELIFYSSNQSSNRTGITNNINDFYSIY